MYYMYTHIYTYIFEYIYVHMYSYIYDIEIYKCTHVLLFIWIFNIWYAVYLYIYIYCDAYVILCDQYVLIDKLKFKFKLFTLDYATTATK